MSVPAVSDISTVSISEVNTTTASITSNSSSTVDTTTEHVSGNSQAVEAQVDLGEEQH